MSDWATHKYESITDMIDNAPIEEPDTTLTDATDEQLRYIISQSWDELAQRPSMDMNRVLNSLERKLL